MVLSLTGTQTHAVMPKSMFRTRVKIRFKVRVTLGVRVRVGEGLVFRLGLGLALLCVLMSG